MVFRGWIAGYLRYGEQGEGTRISDIQARELVYTLDFGFRAVGREFLQIVELRNQIIPMIANFEFFNSSPHDVFRCRR